MTCQTNYLLKRLKAPVDRFANVLKQLFKRLALRSATWDGRDFSPEATLLSVMDYDFDFHAANYTIPV